MPLDRWPSSPATHWWHNISVFQCSEAEVIFMSSWKWFCRTKVQLQDCISYLQLFNSGWNPNAFQYVRRLSILVFVYESKLLARLDSQPKPPQGMASPPWPYKSQQWQNLYEQLFSVTLALPLHLFFAPVVSFQSSFPHFNSLSLPHPHHLSEDKVNYVFSLVLFFADAAGLYLGCLTVGVPGLNLAAASLSHLLSLAPGDGRGQRWRLALYLWLLPLKCYYIELH